MNILAAVVHGFAPPVSSSVKPSESQFSALLLEHGAAFLEPLEVAARISRNGRGSGGAVQHVNVFPSFELGVAISKGKAAGAAVVAGRNIKPGAGVGITNEVTVVDPNRIFIEQHPS